MTQLSSSPQAREVAAPAQLTGPDCRTQGGATVSEAR